MYRTAVEKLGEKAHTKAQKTYCRCCPKDSAYTKWAREHKPHYKKVKIGNHIHDYDGEENDYNAWKKEEEEKKRKEKELEERKKHGIEIRPNEGPLPIGPIISPPRKSIIDRLIPPRQDWRGYYGM